MRSLNRSEFVATLVAFAALCVSSQARADATWQSLGVPSTQLPQNAACALDTQRYRFVLFGGDLTGVSTSVGTTWAFDQHGGPANGVVPRAPGDPPGRSGAAMIYDPIGDRMILTGGVYGASDVWQRSESDGVWTQLFPVGLVPHDLLYSASAYDPVRHRMILFGGFGGSSSSDVWALSLDGVPAWSLVTPAGPAPTPRGGSVLTYDSLRDRMVMFGGRDWHGGSPEVWSLTLDASPAWARFYPEVLGTTGRWQGSAFYDAHRDRLVVWGGHGSPQAPRALSLTPPIAWSDVTVTNAPPTWRGEHASYYDPILDRLFVCGGITVVDYLTIGPDLQDSWALQFGSPVTAVEPGTTPRFAIEHLRRAPDGTIEASVTLRGTSEATLDLFDVSGRRIASARMAAGAREVTLHPIGVPAAGIFFARLHQGSESATSRVALLK